MRTTISLDDRLGEAAKRQAAKEGLSLSAFMARALRAALQKKPASAAVPPFRLITVGGAPHPGVDLDRTADLLAADDEATFAARTPRTAR